MMDLRALSRTLGGEVCGRQIQAPALGHSPQDRSLSIRLDPAAPDGFLVHCFGHGDPLAEKDRIRDLLGLRSHERQKEPDREPSFKAPPSANDKRRTASALAIWDESFSPFGTLVEC